MYSNGQIDATTAMKMLAESSQQKASQVAPVASPATSHASVNQGSGPPAETNKRPCPSEPEGEDSDGELSGEEFSHLES